MQRKRWGMGWALSALLWMPTWVGAASFELQSAEQGHYFAHIKQLYPNQSEREGLLAHTNALLEQYALKAGYQVGQNQRQDEVYRLSIGQATELVLRRELRSQGQVAVSNQVLPVFGLDPFIRYECPPSGIRCEFKNPAGGRPLFSVVRNHEGAAEIAKALSYLIRNLQKG